MPQARQLYLPVTWLLTVRFLCALYRRAYHPRRPRLQMTMLKLQPPEAACRPTAAKASKRLVIQPWAGML